MATTPPKGPARSEARVPRAHAKDSRINLRVSSSQEQLIRRAAAATDRSLTDFVLESAAQRAEQILADRRWFVLAPEEWNRFEGLLEAPLSHTDELQELLTERGEIELPDP